MRHTKNAASRDEKDKLDSAVLGVLGGSLSSILSIVTQRGLVVSRSQVQSSLRRLQKRGLVEEDKGFAPSRWLGLDNVLAKNAASDGVRPALIAKHLAKAYAGTKPTKEQLRNALWDVEEALNAAPKEFARLEMLGLSPQDSARLLVECYYLDTFNSVIDLPRGVDDDVAMVVEQLAEELGGHTPENLLALEAPPPPRFRWPSKTNPSR